MILEITEKCTVEQEDNDGVTEGIRMYTYESSKSTNEEAIVDFIENYDSDNIIKSEDYFDGQCLDSKLIKIEIINETE